MNRAEERRRFQSGVEPKEKPAGLGPIHLIAHCPGNAEDVLRKCRETLAIVLEQDEANWPTTETWRSLLPQWFVSESAPEISQEEAERRRRLPIEERKRLSEEAWSVSAWVYWFQPTMREWFWWDAVVEDPNTLSVAVEVNGWPFPWGALKWLLRASGAASVEPEKPLKPYLDASSL